MRNQAAQRTAKWSTESAASDESASATPAQPTQPAPPGLLGPAAPLACPRPPIGEGTRPQRVESMPRLSGERRHGGGHTRLERRRASGKAKGWREEACQVEEGDGTLFQLRLTGRL